jgi:hypothetical protein
MLMRCFDLNHTIHRYNVPIQCRYRGTYLHNTSYQYFELILEVSAVLIGETIIVNAMNNNINNGYGHSFTSNVAMGVLASPLFYEK